MKVKIRKTKSRSTDLCHYKLTSCSDYELALAYMTHTWGRPDDGELPEPVYRRLWERFQAELCTPAFDFQPRTLECFPGHRPWPYWWFLHGRVPPNHREWVEPFLLDSLKALDGPELEMVHERERQARVWPRPSPGLPFTRAFSWWRFESHDPRDWTKPEHQQLTALRVLDDEEQQLLSEDDVYDCSVIFAEYHDILMSQQQAVLGVAAAETSAKRGHQAGK